MTSLNLHFIYLKVTSSKLEFLYNSFLHNTNIIKHKIGMHNTQ